MATCLPAALSAMLARNQRRDCSRMGEAERDRKGSDMQGVPQLQQDSSSTGEEGNTEQTTGSKSPRVDTLGGSFNRDALAPYARPHLGRSLLDLATSVVPYLALSVAMLMALKVSYLLVLAISIPAGGFLVRTF